MSSPYASRPSNLRSLRDRLVQAAKKEGLVFGRLQQHVAVFVVTQLAARLTDVDGAPLLAAERVQQFVSRIDAAGQPSRADSVGPPTAAAMPRNVRDSRLPIDDRAVSEVEPHRSRTVRGWVHADTYDAGEAMQVDASASRVAPLRQATAVMRQSTRPACADRYSHRTGAPNSVNVS